jgi:hypothetical protein
MVPFGKMVGSFSEKVLPDSAEISITTCHYVGPKRPQNFLIFNSVKTSDIF